MVDLSDGIAGSFCTRLLAGLGAEIIKIEKPGQGDSARSMEPHLPGPDCLDRSALFNHLNAGKKSVTSDLKSPKGRELVQRLVGQAQVVVENFRPGQLDSLGLGFSSLSQLNASLVLTSISAFGQYGPYRDYLATNLGCLAMGGMLYSCGEPDSQPIEIGGNQAEYVAGLTAAVATLAAVLHAELTGEGQWIDVSVMESVALMLEEALATFADAGTVYPRQGNRHGRTYPMTILPCKDGFAGVMLANDSDWELFARFTGNEELLELRFASGEDRARLASELEQLLQPFLMQRTREQIFHWAQELRLPFSLVLSPDDLLNDPQHRARGFFATTHHPLIGDLLQLGAPFKMQETPWRTDRAPLLGEHTEEILCQRLGLAQWEIWQLKSESVL
ncbi:MAG: CoA transferase [Chloroflexi bacterium]|nr:CoA transferase [Chloroflexota bacterium]